ncbi:uncharacterized protein [Haliotis asinina]|uniref:uncharacterized protein isoform X2 n=2 Tax=Haliotis asinina TaxID=109174 RepID=UPI003531A584
MSPRVVPKLVKLVMHFKQILVLLLCCLQPRPVSCLNTNPCAKNFDENCIKCNRFNECIECLKGYYGSSCEKKCIGHCQFDCDIQTGLCRTCQDGFHGDNCSVPCSKTCFENACERSTGACNGCRKGHCFPKTECVKTCSDKCPNNCDFETCGCLTPASPQYTSTTPRPPKQGKYRSKNNTQTYLIGCVFNPVYLLICLAICYYERRIWTSLYCLWHKNPRRERGDLHQQPLANECIEAKFQAIPNDKADTFASHASANKDKNNNRYSYPYDHNRVVLTNNEYINATHIEGTTMGITRSYITTQQPMKNTKTSFWRMIWEKEVGTIVILSSNEKNEIDRNLRGANMNHDFEDIQVRTSGNLIRETSWTVRNLRIQNNRDNRPEMDVNIFLFSKWYRKGSFCDFLEALRRDTTFKRNASPVTIFSSEGEGPAAIFIALDYLLESVNTNDNKNPPDLYECVNRLAEQRRSMFPDATSLKRLRECYWLLQERNPVSRSTRTTCTSRESTVRCVWVGILVFVAISVCALVNYVGVTL